MNKRIFTVMLVVVLALVAIVPSSVSAQDDEQLTFYWITHGTPGDFIWTLVEAGALRAGDDLGIEVRTSWHNGDVAAHKEAFQSAIAAGADGIITSSPAEGALADEIAAAKEAGIPVVFMNTDDPELSDAYVGGDLMVVGQMWANYMVDNGLVEAGDKVFGPVEVPGATYQTLELEGIMTVFEPLGIEVDVVDGTVDAATQRQVITDYLNANGDEVDAIIGLGDLVMSATVQVLPELGYEPGEIPAVGWGNSDVTAKGVLDGYANAAMFQYPDTQGYLPVVMLKNAIDGQALGYIVTTQGLYEADQAQYYIDLFSQ